MKYIIPSFVLLMLLFVQQIFALSTPADSSFTFVLPQVKIYEQRTNKEEIIFFNDHDKYTFTISDNTLVADTVKYKYSLELSKLNKIGIHDGNHFWGAAGYGALIGFSAGFLVGSALHAILYTLLGESSPATFGGSLGWGVLYGAIFAVPVGIVGGLIGLLAPNYELYEFKNSDLSKKRNDVYNVFRRWGRRISH